MAEVNPSAYAVLDLTHTKYSCSDESWLRRWLVANGDIGMAAHSQLKNYFLADSTLFGVTGIYAAPKGSGNPLALVFWSRDSDMSFIHQVVYSSYVVVPGGLLLEKAYLMLARPRSQIFVRSLLEVRRDCWDVSLEVRAGDVTNHSAYDGVFSRTVPRFDGFVLERRANARTTL